ncbi:hypothetical protein KOW79_006156 [Hemibagrus wyckioides]|uniref:Uncharacterized protein n=1 Tax=Hemibagrus wyckioides TaxID=337641 RepID=A0A9D3NWM1_9TELE|nr:hypothetical protein KOW79_006156 [Hemibagrus wyckioides]
MRTLGCVFFCQTSKKNENSLWVKVATEHRNTLQELRERNHAHRFWFCHQGPATVLEESLHGGWRCKPQNSVFCRNGELKSL